MNIPLHRKVLVKLDTLMDEKEQQQKTRLYSRIVPFFFLYWIMDIPISLFCGIRASIFNSQGQALGKELGEKTHKTMCRMQNLMTKDIKQKRQNCKIRIYLIECCLWCLIFRFVEISIFFCKICFYLLKCLIIITVVELNFQTNWPQIVYCLWLRKKGCEYLKRCNI